MEGNTMNRQEYNGWTNYETWVVSLWMDNEKGSYDYWRSVAAQIASPNSPEYIKCASTQKCRLADILKDNHEEELPELTGFAADLLNAAMSEVDWFSIAEHLIEGLAEEISA
jgi:hypothetical protein